METNYPEVVYEIHNEFLTSGDKLLAEAQEFLKTPPKVSQQKINRLKLLGFVETVDVKKPDEIRSIASINQRLMEAITDFKVRYPNYKFITEGIVKKICDKYGLVNGKVNQFKGFVPEKNLSDIEFFFFTHPELKNSYFKRYAWQEIEITKEEFDRQSKENIPTNFKMGYDPMSNNISVSSYVFMRPQNILQEHFGIASPLPPVPSLSPSRLPLNQFEMARQMVDRQRDTEREYLANQYQQQKSQLIERNVELEICAPLHEMDVQGYDVKDGYKLVYDPIVLCPISHHNGIKGSLVITAWGDEASDELVVDQNKN